MSIKQKFVLCIMLCFSCVCSGYQLETQVEKDAGACDSTSTYPCEGTCENTCDAMQGYYRNIGLGNCVNGQCRCLCGDPGTQYIENHPQILQEHLDQDE